MSNIATLNIALTWILKRVEPERTLDVDIILVHITVSTPMSCKTTYKNKKPLPKEQGLVDAIYGMPSQNRRSKKCD